MSAPVGVQREDTVDDYSRGVAGRAVGCADAADGPAKGGKSGGGVLVESGFGGRAVWSALEAAVGAAAAAGHPTGIVFSQMTNPRPSTWRAMAITVGRM
jgi:hypothetical protein